MKYTAFSGFEKHLSEAFPEHLAPAYFVSCAHGEDRKVILSKMVAQLASKAEVVRFPLGSLSKDLFPLVREQSLFSSIRLFVVDEITLEGEEEALARFLQTPPHKVHFFLGLASGKELKGMADAVKKGAVWLDLSKEKPWEREKRLLASLRDMVLKSGKVAAPDLLEQLLHLIGGDWQKLEREVEKLIAYVGSKRELHLADLRKVITAIAEQTGWQIAEEIVWGQKGIPEPPTIDTSELLALLGAVRYQIQLGWQLASAPLDTPPSHLKPYQIQKYGKLAHAKPLLFFERALLQLFELEKLSKSTSLDPNLLITRFSATLREAL